MCSQHQLKKSTKARTPSATKMQRNLQSESSASGQRRSTSTKDQERKTAIQVCDCHSRYKSMSCHQRHQDTLVQTTKRRHTSIHARGLVTGSTEICAPPCSCNQEMGFLQTLLKRLHADAARTEASLLKMTLNTKRNLSSDDMMLFEAYAGEVGYLRGMLRDCDGTTTKSIAVEVEVRTTLRPKAVLMGCAAGIAGFVLAYEFSNFCRRVHVFVPG